MGLCYFVQNLTNKQYLANENNVIPVNFFKLKNLKVKVFEYL